MWPAQLGAEGSAQEEAGFCLVWFATPQNARGLGFLDFMIHTLTLYSSSREPWKCGGGRKKGVRHRWDHLTYSDGIEESMAIFRTLDFRAPSLCYVGVPGLEVSE